LIDVDFTKAKTDKD